MSVMSMTHSSPLLFSAEAPTVTTTWSGIHTRHGACCNCQEHGDCPTCRIATCDTQDNVTRWVFAVSTGHAGTTTLGNAACYHAAPDDIAWQFEGDHSYGDTDESTSAGLKMWYANLASRSEAEVEASALAFVKDVIVPDMRLRSAGKRTHVDLGHHVNLGLMQPLATALAPQVSFVRIIRSRYDMVRSFLPGKAPCVRGMFTLCPLTHPQTVLSPRRDVWANLSTPQMNLWFIDEVEARWQQLLRRNPKLPHRTVHWCDKRQLQAAWSEIGALIGDGPTGHQLRPNLACGENRVHGQNDVTDDEMEILDQNYHAAMGYTADELSMIKAVQRPHDCAQ